MVVTLALAYDSLRSRRNDPPEWEVEMPEYIALISWTDQGAQKATESLGRAQAFKNMAKEMGCQVHGFFYTMGQYDMTTRVEAPDDETISALILKVGQLGNVRSVTMRAFTEDQFADIVKKATE